MTLGLTAGHESHGIGMTKIGLPRSARLYGPTPPTEAWEGTKNGGAKRILGCRTITIPIPIPILIPKPFANLLTEDWVTGDVKHLLGVPGEHGGQGVQGVQGEHGEQ